MDLIIFSGQSNMQGQTERLPYDNSAIENALEYRLESDALIPLTNPAGENIDKDGSFFTPDFQDIPSTIERSALLAAWENYTNMVPQFCKSYTEATGRQVVAAHCAKGSTFIEYWLKGNTGYTFLLKKASAAIKKVQPERIFFVWLQGESNAIIGTAKEEYKAGLLALNADLKNELGIEKFGIIRVGEFAGEGKDLAIMEAQAEVCEENDDFLMLTTITEQLTKIKKYMNPFAYGHYSCEGQELIGAFAGIALGEYVNRSVL